MTEERSHMIKLSSDPYGNITVALSGNLSIAEVMFGLQLAENVILEKAKSLGIARPPTRIELNPKRF